MKYFVLNFPNIAYVTNFCPQKKPTFTSTINVRGLYPVTIMSFHKIQSPHEFSQSIEKKHISVYKSNLQKCVRRMMIDKAVRSAYLLLSIDPGCLLRRLTVIMLEDVRLHTSFINLVWWMMAVSKGYKLCDDEISYILGVVYMLCEIEEREEKKNSNDFPKLNLTILNPQESELLESIQFRCTYGGMKCDVNMFNYFVRFYYNKFKRDTSYETSTYKTLESPQVNFVDLDSVGFCDKNDVILCAIDYHCCPWLLNQMAQNFQHIPIREIKYAIWVCRSNVNDRKFLNGKSYIIPQKVKETYEEIKDKFDDLALSFWMKL